MKTHPTAVIFKRAWAEIFLVMSDEDAGKLIKGICRELTGQRKPNHPGPAYIQEYQRRITAGMDRATKHISGLLKEIGTDPED